MAFLLIAPLLALPPDLLRAADRQDAAAQRRQRRDARGDAARGGGPARLGRKGPARRGRARRVRDRSSRRRRRPRRSRSWPSGSTTSMPGFRTLLAATARALPSTPPGPAGATPSRASTRTGASPHLGGASPRLRPPTPTSICWPRSTSSATAPTDRPARAGRSGDLPEPARAHLLDQRDGHAALPGARLSARLPPGDAARRAAQPADDPGPAAVLDVAAGAHRRLGRAAAARGRGQRRCCAGSA